MSVLDFLRGADDPRQRRHAHTCEACGHVFIHDPDACIGSGATEGSCAAAHVCPQCGAEQRYVDVERSDPQTMAELCADGAATCPIPERGDPPMAGANDPSSNDPAANPLGALGGLLGGLLGEAQKQAAPAIQGAGQQAGQAAGQAAADATKAAIPQIVAAAKAELPGLAAALGQAVAPAVAPIARQAGQEAGQAAGETAAKAARAEVERQKAEIRAEVSDTLKVGGLVVAGLAVVGGGLWLIFGGKRKKGGS